MARTPRSFHLEDLKGIVIETDTVHRRYGRMIQIKCDHDMEFRDLGAYDTMLFTATKTVVSHPDYCRYRLMEKDKLSELMELKYNEQRDRPRLLFIPQGFGY